MNFNYISNRMSATFNFKRVNVVLGANGTGKSKLLNELKEQAHSIFNRAPNKIIYVEGGRAITINGSLQLNRNNFQQYQTPATATSTRVGKLKSTISSRIQDGLILLDVRGQELKSKHSDQVHEWAATGSTGDCPSRPAPPIEDLIRLFQEIFPKISLVFNESNKTLTCSKDGSAPYDLSELSDGEKQVIAILSDIALLAEEESVIIVDEPELNLNPSLAIKLWHTIEQELSEAIFIYASHSVSFAQRENVSKIIALSSESEHILEINELHEIPKAELSQLLGAIPAILSNSRILVTEGEESSFDSILYRWLLGTNDIEILPEGSCDNVQAIVSRSGVWEKIATTLKISGVIDRDYKSQETITSIGLNGVLVLDLHEAESYLCIPNLVVKVTEKLSLVDSIPTVNEIESIIFQKLEENSLIIAAQRVIKKSNATLAVSVERKILNCISNLEDLEAAFREEATEQTNFALRAIGPDAVAAALKEEIASIEQVLSDRDVVKALSLCPGKPLLAEIVKLTGAKSFLDLLRAATTHITIEEMPEINALSTKISGLFNDIQ